MLKLRATFRPRNRILLKTARLYLKEFSAARDSGLFVYITQLTPPYQAIALALPPK
jgi:hypothetical protein